MSTKKSNEFRFKDVPSLLKRTFILWKDSDPFRLSAIIAYYAILSLPALLIIVIFVVEKVWGAEIMQGKLTGEFSSAFGKETAEAIQSMIESARIQDGNLLNKIIGIATLVFGATGVFYHLQVSLDKIWGTSGDVSDGFWQIVKDRVLSFGFVLVLGFLLLISLVVSSLLSALNEKLRAIFPDVYVVTAQVLDFVISTGFIWLLFSLLFRYLPHTPIRWKSVWIGGLLTALLFDLGKGLLAFYFGEAEPDSTYGAAGSVVLLLLWVSYSCLILFFGAQFTYAYAEKYGALSDSELDEGN